MNQPEAAKRLFFALWPTPALQADMARRVRKAIRGGGGRPVSPDRLHLTLAFLGSLDADAQACVEAAADSIHCGAFELVMDRLGYFPRARVLWVGTAVPPAPLLELFRALSGALMPCGYRPEARPFSAHVTVMRKAARGPATAELAPVIWPVDSFVLMESLTLPEGAQYHELRRWSLLAPE